MVGIRPCRVSERELCPVVRATLPGAQMRGKQYNQPLKLTAPWEKDAGFGRKLKTYRNHTKIIAQPGIVMKVLRRKRIVLFMAYILLLVLTMLNLANYKWTKEPQQCNHQMRSTTYQSRSDIRFPLQAPVGQKEAAHLCPDHLEVGLLLFWGAL